MDVQKLRWVVFFIMLGLTAVFLERRKSSIPSQHQMVAAITLSTLVYMAAYLLHGITAENIRGSFRWDLQTVEWGATVYAMFPIAFAMPAVLLSTVSGSSWHRLVGWVTLLLTFVAVIYYESRIGLFTVLAFLVLSPIYIGGRRLLGILTLVAALLVLFGPSIRYQHGSLSEYGSSLLLSGSAFWPRGDIADTHDIDRWIHAKLAFKAVSGDWSTFLFGHGYRVHGEVISPYLYELYREFLPRSAQRIAYYQSTAGFTALVVDTGVVALALLVTNFLLVGCRIIREKELAYKPLLLLSLVLPFAWLLSGNILDITLLYVGVMPSGLLVGMARAGGRNALAQRSPPAASGLGYRRGWPRLAGAGLSGR